MLLCYIISWCIILHYIILYYVILYYVILCYILFRCQFTTYIYTHRTRMLNISIYICAPVHTAAMMDAYMQTGMQ